MRISDKRHDYWDYVINIHGIDNQLQLDRSYYNKDIGYPNPYVNRHHSFFTMHIWVGDLRYNFIFDAETKTVAHTSDEIYVLLISSSNDEYVYKYVLGMFDDDFSWYDKVTRTNLRDKINNNWEETTRSKNNTGYVSCYQFSDRSKVSVGTGVLLSGTPIKSLLTPEQAYQEIYNYSIRIKQLESESHKPDNDTMKKNHGFDDKSFRNTGNRLK